MKKPNILLISIDSLRADHLSLYGYDKETSPYLTELAFRGTVYEHAISPANWTGASISSILTGLYPTSHGYTNKRYYLDDGEDTIASILKNNGYFTICFSNNLYLSHRTGLGSGFDDFRYRGVFEHKDVSLSKRKNKNIITKLKKLPGARQKLLVNNLMDVFSPQRAVTRDDGAFSTEIAFNKWLSNYNSQKPFFVYIHYQEPHSVYFPPYPYRRRFFSGSWMEEGRFLQFEHMAYFAGKKVFTESLVEHYKELYDGEIAYLDWRLGRLFKSLKSRAIFDNTLVIVTADHGEMFGEHGFFWHAFCLYEPLIRVPLIIRYPPWFKEDHRSNELVQTNDLVPTILHGLGLDWKYIDEHQGQSFFDRSKRNATLTESFNPEPMIDRWLLRNRSLEKSDFDIFMRDLVAYRSLTEKYISASDKKDEFYNLKTDPFEEQNLYKNDDGPVLNCQKSLKNWIESLKPHVANDTQPAFDKDTWEKMKTLGYA